MANRKRIALLADLPRGRHATYVGTPPHSYFESPLDLMATESLRFQAASNELGKMFLGVLDGEVVTERRAPGMAPGRYIQGGTPCGILDDRHHVLIANNRGDKGRSFIIPNLICLPNSTSILCIDPKGELSRITARWRAEGLGQAVGVLDPFGVSGPGTERLRIKFNPLGMLARSDRRTFVPNAKLIADSLIVSGDLKELHWDETAKQILAALCAHAATYWCYEGARDLVTVWHLISELKTVDRNDPKCYWLQKELESNDAAGGMIRNGCRQFYDRTGGEFNSVLSNLRKHTDWISIACMQDSLRGESRDLRDFKRSSMCWYATLPAMRMGDLRGWLRLLVQLTLAAHEEEQQQVGGSTHLFLEEFNVLGRLECLELAAGQIAGLGVKLIPILQGIDQLKHHYPRNWETFLSNAGVLQVFSIADLGSQEYVSKKLGQAPTLSRSTNAPSFDQASQQAATGESWSLGVHPLLDPEEVGRFFGRDDKLLRQLVLRPGYRPAILQRAYYDKHDLFAGKFDDE